MKRESSTHRSILAHQARRGRAGFGKLQVRVVSPDLGVVTLAWLIRTNRTRRAGIESGLN